MSKKEVPPEDIVRAMLREIPSKSGSKEASKAFERIIAERDEDLARFRKDLANKILRLSRNRTALTHYGRKMLDDLDFSRR